MNLGDLWSGNDYAWYQYKKRGEIYRPDARRVKVIRTFKEKLYGNERETGYAEVMMLADDGTPRERSDGTHVTQKVRARDIAMRWEEYADERAHREAEREKLAREREELERKENERKSQLQELLVSRCNIPAEAISSIGASSIYLHRAILEKELGLINE